MTIHEESTTMDTSLYVLAGELCHQDASARIVGSIARSAILGQLLPAQRPDGSDRNFNALHIQPLNYTTYGNDRLDFNGVALSTRFDQWVRTESNGDTWLVFPTHPENAIPIPEPQEVFQPFAISIGETEIITTLPCVLARINHLMGVQRPKDKGKFDKFEVGIADMPAGINPELLAPFDKFDEIMRRQKAYHIKAMLRNLYHQTFPPQSREKLRLSQRVKPLGLTPYVKAPTHPDSSTETNNYSS